MRRHAAPLALARYGLAVLAVAATVALALWLLPPEIDSPLTIGLSAVVLGLPLVRLGLAPLALEWNRHR